MPEKEFRENIYRYCDNNVKGEVLFPAFSNLWIQSVQEISPQYLTTLTGRIINDLVRDGILKEISKPSDFDVPYGMYEILPHNKLRDNNKKD